jgi:hypothetical protein
MNFKYAALSSIALSFILTIFSICVALSDASPNPSLIIKVIGWNIFLAVSLINAGWLTSCGDCEMASLLYVLSYGFIIGIICYSLATFGVIFLITKLKAKSSPKSSLS